jgi:osmoprotectant transport system permease protein
MACAGDAPLVVGSKRFTESYILGEILVRTAGAGTVHRQGMGGTAILFEALRAGAIDVYPEYTGTIAAEILKGTAGTDLAALNTHLAPLGLAASVPLGFSNGYSLAMREADATRLSVRTIGDLARLPALRVGLSPEFLNRKDGWPAIRRSYGLPHAATGLDHGLAYEALASGTIDVIDLYTTDAKQVRYRLRVLEDEQAVFPPYAAVLLHRADTPARHPVAWLAIQRLAGTIPAERMLELNAQAELAGRSFVEVAASFEPAGGTGGAASAGRAPVVPTGVAAEPRGAWQVLFGPDLPRLTMQHAALVLVAVLVACAVGIPLGVLGSRGTPLGRLALLATGLVQVVPSLALLAILIPVTRSVGMVPAAIALFLYALLPIVRNTATGILSIPPGLRDAAIGMGLSGRDRLFRVELPLAAPAILAGVRTAAVVTVGTATIAAFVGAGGFGERIASGLALNDHALLIAGAVPAAAMALLLEWGLTRIERSVVSRGLRAAPGGSRGSDVGG